MLSRVMNFVIRYTTPYNYRKQRYDGEISAINKWFPRPERGEREKVAFYLWRTKQIEEAKRYWRI